MGEDQILDVSQKVLYLAQNFDKEFPGLENLKKTHFGIITQLLWIRKPFLEIDNTFKKYDEVGANIVMNLA